ncbi:MAG: hypothetical protein KGP14_03780 [Betaproteobacteria bacterium]|nr:hypothetical protein [Betaproteobacteria bacterium]
MDSFQPVPTSYQPQGLNFQPLNALTQQMNDYTNGTYQQANLDNNAALRQIQQQNADLNQSKFDQATKVQNALQMGNQAMAISQLPVGPERTAAYQRFLQQHPDYQNLDPAYLDPTSGPQLVAAEFGQVKDSLQRQKLQAEIASQNARTAYYKAAASRFAPPPNGGQQADPLAGYGMNEDGQIVPPNRLSAPGAAPAMGAPAPPQAGIDTPYIFSSVLGDRTEEPAAAVKQSDWGPYGKSAENIPGVAVGAGGNMDARATYALTGQAAIDKKGDDDRQRLIKYRDTQAQWTYLKGKAPSGFEYNDDGSLHDMKADSKMSIAAAKASPMIGDIVNAKHELVDNGSTMLGRNMAMTPWLRSQVPATRAAIENLNHTVATMTALVEGNRHANAQDVRFLKYFSIEPDDTRDDVGRKLDQLYRIYNTYVGNKSQTAPGTLYKYKELQDLENNGYSTNGLPSQAQGAPPLTAAPPTQQDVTQQRLKNKYGLE